MRIRWCSTTLTLIGCTPLMVVLAQAQTEIDGDALAEARRKVSEFELPLLRQLLEPTTPTNTGALDELRSDVREFFTTLDDSAMKIAAIEMLDDRYVRVIDPAPDMAAELLGPLLHDAVPVVRARAAQAIGYTGCGARHADQLIAMLQHDPPATTLSSVAYAMGRSRHQPFVSHLVKLLAHAEPEVRSKASFELTRLAPETAFEHNSRLLTDRDASVRAAAVQNLALTRDPRAIAPAQRLLDDADHTVREHALSALGQLQSSGSADVVARRLADPHPHVRARAAEVLGDLQATEHADALASLLQDENVVARRYATKALGAMGERRFIGTLRALLNDADDQIREHAADSIRRLNSIE